MPGERQAPQGILAFVTMSSARARLCTAEKPPSLRAGSRTTRAPSGTLGGCQHPRFIDGDGDPEQGDWPFPCDRRGSSQVLSPFIQLKRKPLQAAIMIKW